MKNPKIIFEHRPISDQGNILLIAWTDGENHGNMIHLKLSTEKTLKDIFKNKEAEICNAVKSLLINMADVMPEDS